MLKEVAGRVDGRPEEAAVGAGFPIVLEALPAWRGLLEKTLQRGRLPEPAAPVRTDFQQRDKELRRRTQKWHVCVHIVRVCVDPYLRTDVQLRMIFRFPFIQVVL